MKLPQRVTLCEVGTRDGFRQVLDDLRSRCCRILQGQRQGGGRDRGAACHQLGAQIRKK